MFRSSNHYMILVFYYNITLHLQISLHYIQYRASSADNRNASSDKSSDIYTRKWNVEWRGRRREARRRERDDDTEWRRRHRATVCTGRRAAAPTYKYVQCTSGGGSPRGERSGGGRYRHYVNAKSGGHRLSWTTPRPGLVRTHTHTYIGLPTLRNI